MQKRFLLMMLVLVLSACGTQTGTLEIQANGEDFARQPFVSKDGWTISFEHIWLTLAEVTAYQTETPFDASLGIAPEGTAVSLTTPHTIDLTTGTEAILLESAEAAVGQFNAVSWDMISGNDGNTLQLVGTAEKDSTSIPFDISITQTYSYFCGEYVGDERKGFVEAEQTGDVELTFHFDHIFGDADTPLDDSLNTSALGFDPLATLATDDGLIAIQSDLEEGLGGDAYALLLDNLATLGHVGEGHCFEAENGYTAKDE
ncbi:MAG: DUF4382 domain-containing protein [Chloroflexota bacterium]